MITASGPDPVQGVKILLDLDLRIKTHFDRYDEMAKDPETFARTLAAFVTSQSGKLKIRAVALGFHMGTDPAETFVTKVEAYGQSATFDIQGIGAAERAEEEVAIYAQSERMLANGTWMPTTTTGMPASASKIVQLLQNPKDTQKIDFEQVVRDLQSLSHNHPLAKPGGDDSELHKRLVAAANGGKEEALEALSTLRQAEVLAEIERTKDLADPDFA